MIQFNERTLSDGQAGRQAPIAAAPASPILLSEKLEVRKIRYIIIACLTVEAYSLNK